MVSGRKVWQPRLLVEHGEKWGLTLVDELLLESSHKPQILLELSDPANDALVVRKRGESIVSPMILSHLMAQIAQRRELGLMLEELFTTGGAQIVYLC